MPDLILPETAPPLVSLEAKEVVSNEILTYGLGSLWDTALPEFYERQPVLYPYVKNFACVDASGNLLLDDRPRNTLRTAAVIAERAYTASGYETHIEDLDKFTIACLEAKFAGIPEAYLVKSLADPILKDLIGVMLRTPEMQDGVDTYGSYEHFLTIGAGLTRHYLQYELVM